MVLAPWPRKATCTKGVLKHVGNTGKHNTFVTFPSTCAKKHMFSNIFEKTQGAEKRRGRFCLHSAADVLEKNMQRGISMAG